MNKVFLIGRLTRDPELRTTQSGISVCTFRLAVSRRFANQQGVREADFINIVVWRAQAETCARYLAKGSQCAVAGSLQSRSYDAQDGTKRYVTEVVADEVEFLARAQRGDSDDGGDDFAPPPANSSYSGDTGFTEVDDDELPF